MSAVAPWPRTQGFGYFTPFSISIQPPSMQFKSLSFDAVCFNAIQSAALRMN